MKMACEQVRDLFLRLDWPLLAELGQLDMPGADASAPEQEAEEIHRAKEHLRECPFCREARGLLENLLAQTTAPVEVMPLPSPGDPVVARVVERLEAEIEHRGGSDRRDLHGRADTASTAKGEGPPVRKRGDWFAVPAITAAALVFLGLFVSLLVVAGSVSRLGDGLVAQMQRENKDLRQERDSARANTSRLQGRLSEAAGTLSRVHEYVIRAMLEPGQSEKARRLAAAYTIGGQGLDTLGDDLRGARLLFQGVYDVLHDEHRSAIQSFDRAERAFSSKGLRCMALFGKGYAEKCRRLHQQSLTTYDTILRLVGDAPQNRSLSAMAQHYAGWASYCLAKEEVTASRYEQAKAKLRKARDRYQLALRAAPNYHKVRYNIGLAFIRSAEIAEQEGKAEQAGGLRRRATESLDAAEQGFTQLLRNNPSNAKARFSLAMVNTEQGKTHPGKKQQALQHLARAIEIDGTLAVLVPEEEVFDCFKGTAQYRAIEEKAKELRGSAPENVLDIFFDADLPTPAPSQRAI